MGEIGVGPKPGTALETMAAIRGPLGSRRRCDARVGTEGDPTEALVNTCGPRFPALPCCKLEHKDYGQSRLTEPV